jgi:hypothetical protein
MRESFEAQFEANGDSGYLYRQNQKGEPIPVTAEERGQFIRQFSRRIGMIMAGLVLGLLVFWGLLIWRTIANGQDLPRMVMNAGTVVIAAVAVALMYWVRSAPARALEGRASIGRERSREEMRAIFFRRVSYGQLAGAGGAGIIIVATRAANENLFVGWHRAWLLLGAGLVLLSAVQAFRKWRFESEHPTDGSAA